LISNGVNQFTPSRKVAKKQKKTGHLSLLGFFVSSRLCVNLIDNRLKTGGGDMPAMTASELEAFLQSHFPEMPEEHDFGFRVEHVEENFVRVRLVHHPRHLRPGGTVSGPALMTLADTAMYLALLAMIGPVAMAVTTSLNINFLRRPAPQDVIAECRLLKLGSRLAVGDVTMFSEGETEPVAQATVTYSIPPSQR
jgi:uncharacterized protein (TIGR00369 family)